jgi:radical SAM protein with 4Fe4S-binding SPASM domain
MSDERIHRVIDEIHAEGALFLAFTGGEPLSHPGVDAFVRHASGIGLLVRLKSNGVLLTRDRVRRLRADGLKAVDVSVYSVTAAVHDDFVRQPRAFERTLSGIRSARDAGIDVSISFLLSSVSVDETEAMIALARGLGVRCNFDTHMTARHDGSRSSLDLGVGRDALERLYRGPFAPFVTPAPARRDSIACPCARSVCGIGSSGDVYPCIAAPLPSGNVKSRSFGEIWRDSPTLNWVRGLGASDFPACAGCDHAAYCRRASGVMLNNTGTFTGPLAFGDDLCCVEAEVVHRLASERADVAPGSESAIVSSLPRGTACDTMPGPQRPPHIGSR